MKKSLSLLLALVMILGLTACNNNAQSSSSQDPTGNGSNTLSVCLSSEPDTLDPALNSAVDGATMIVHLFSGLAKWSKDASGKLVIAADLVKELVEGVANEDGTITYTYTLKADLKWSDGQPVTANNFVYSWNRAASSSLAADYNYMFDIIDGYDAIWETDADGNYVNPDAKLNVQALDDKTLQVTLKNAVPYWNELLAFPTYCPVREDVVANEAWATSPATYICNGPYVMTGWEHNSVITLEKNPNFHDAASVTMNTIKVYLSDDQNNMLTNFENGSWQFIDDVPTNEIPNLKAKYPEEFAVIGQIGTYYSCWNVNENILPANNTLTGIEAEKAKAEVRKALSLLLDRNYIVEEIGQAGQVPASSFVAMGMTNPDGTQFYETAGYNEGYIGYYNVSKEAVESNYASAVATLKKYYTYDEATGKFTNFPTITYLYNTGEGHKAIAEYIQSAFAQVGITLNLENQEWNTFLNTRKAGNYSMARNGWLADYNDPICFLDMWTTVSGNNDVQLGKGAHASIAIYNLDLTPYGYDIHVKNGTWAQTYDKLIDTIKACADTDTRYQMMHLAEDMLMDTGCINPLYFYTDIYMLNKNVKGFFANPLGYKYFMHCTIS